MPDNSDAPDILPLSASTLDLGTSQRAIDGIKIVFPDSWALIRASNTSPLLRLSIEARNQERLDELEKEMTKLIKSVNAN